MAEKLPGMRRFYFLAGVLFLFGLAFSLWFFGGRISFGQTSFYPQLYPQIWSLSGNARITQRFRSGYPGLHQINIYVARRGEVETGQIILRMKETCNAANDLVTAAAMAAQDAIYSCKVKAKSCSTMKVPFTNLGGPEAIWGVKSGAALDVFAVGEGGKMIHYGPVAAP